MRVCVCVCVCVSARPGLIAITPAIHSSLTSSLSSSHASDTGKHVGLNFVLEMTISHIRVPTTPGNLEFELAAGNTGNLLLEFS